MDHKATMKERWANISFSRLGAPNLLKVDFCCSSPGCSCQLRLFCPLVTSEEQVYGYDFFLLWSCGPTIPHRNHLFISSDVMASGVLVQLLLIFCGQNILHIFNWIEGVSNSLIEINICQTRDFRVSGHSFWVRGPGRVYIFIFYFCLSL